MSQWLLQAERKLNKKASFICLPYAGGSSSSFRHWGKKIPDFLELSVAELPGRNQRFGEPFVSDIEQVVESLYQSLKTLGDAPVFIFGHSLGCLIAYELCLKCYQDCQNISVKGLIVSGKMAPHLAARERKIHKVGPQEFRRLISEYEGMPKEVLENQELFDFVEPRLRSDFELSENYQSKKEIQQVNCPIMGMAGTLDKHASPDSVAKWQQYTCNEFSMKAITGGHFFIKEQEDVVIKEITRFISDLIC